MKTKNVLLSLTITGLLACSINTVRADDAADKANAAVNKAQGTVDDAKASAKATAKAQGLIDKAKKYIADKKYQPALDTLNKLKGMKLTSAQQTVVDSLKTQLKSLMANSDTGKALGGLLK